MRKRSNDAGNTGENRTSVNQLVRDYLQSLVVRKDRKVMVEEFLRNATGHCGCSPKGYRFDREAAQRSAA